MEKNNKQANLELEYSQINNNFRFLAEVRFKLLALVPILGGAAVFVLAHSGLEAGKALEPASPELLLVMLVSLFGFLATLGITLYDQRNSELYNALVDRAKWLEGQLGLLKMSRAPKPASGGQFNERPVGNRRLIFPARHGLALALIYGPLLGGWLFPILYSASRQLTGIGNESAQLTSAIVAATAALVCARWLIKIDARPATHQKSEKRKGLKADSAPFGSD